MSGRCDDIQPDFKGAETAPLRFNGAVHLTGHLLQTFLGEGLGLVTGF